MIEMWYQQYMDVDDQTLKHPRKGARSAWRVRSVEDKKSFLVVNSRHGPEYFFRLGICFLMKLPNTY